LQGFVGVGAVKIHAFSPFNSLKKTSVFQATGRAGRWNPTLVLEMVPLSMVSNKKLRSFRFT
jgi:hypothetical protein